MIYLNLKDNLKFYCVSRQFNDELSRDMVYKFLKGKYERLDLFKRDFCGEGSHVDNLMSNKLARIGFLNDLFEQWDDIVPFTYEEAFKLKNSQFRADVFGTVNITDMIEHLGHTRLKTAGRRVERKQFDNEGNFIGMKEYDVIFETHEVNGEKLNISGRRLYVLKCWCTSTNEEHWLWIESIYKDDPLSAVSSTFRIHENLIPHVKEIKRQGDVLLVETGDVDIQPEGNLVPLTAEQYFGWLTAES